MSNATDAYLHFIVPQVIKNVLSDQPGPRRTSEGRPNQCGDC